MKRLLLFRHAKSSWDDPALADHERPLAPRGHRAAERMAEHLRSSIPRPDLVLCSSALRTRETLERMSNAFGDAEVVVDDGLYGATDDELLERLHRVADRSETVAMIGHNPGIHDLAIALAGGGAELDRMRTKFPTGALAVLEFDGSWHDLGPGDARLAAFVAPKDLGVSDVSAHDPDGLSLGDLGPDPIARLVAWLDDARAAGIRLPEAAALATADAAGRPAVRHVLVKVVDERGLTFFTNHQSRKGRHLAENPHAALAFSWRELDRQVCVGGPASRVDDAESDAYFRTRPREARLGAWASRQSRPVGSRQELDAAFAEISARFPDEDVPLPPHWGGYRIEPESIEFWKGREHRLHDRFRFMRVDGAWRIERLWP